jgi:hypothetical protein
MWLANTINPHNLEIAAFNVHSRSDGTALAYHICTARELHGNQVLELQM